MARVVGHVEVSPGDGNAMLGMELEGLLILLSAAIVLPRNLDRRVEMAFSVLDRNLQAQVREILEDPARRYGQGAPDPGSTR